MIQLYRSSLTASVSFWAEIRRLFQTVSDRVVEFLFLIQAEAAYLFNT